MDNKDNNFGKWAAEYAIWGKGQIADSFRRIFFANFLPYTIAFFLIVFFANYPIMLIPAAIIAPFIPTIIAHIIMRRNNKKLQAMRAPEYKDIW